MIGGPGVVNLLGGLNNHATERTCPHSGGQKRWGKSPTLMEDAGPINGGHIPKSEMESTGVLCGTRYDAAKKMIINVALIKSMSASAIGGFGNTHR